MKKILLAISLAIAKLAFAATPIEIVVPTAPGGPTDTISRTLGKILTDQGYETVIAYHPGGNGIVAYNRTMEKGNNVILVASIANTVYPNIIDHKDPLHALNMKMFGPHVSVGGVFAAPVDGRFKDFNQLIETAKKEEVLCGTSAPNDEVELQIINKKHGTNFVPVPFIGTSKLLPAIMGNQVSCALDTSPLSMYTNLKGKVLVLATTNASKLSPDVTSANSVWKGYVFTNFWGPMVPKTSNLLADEKLVHILNTWTSDTENMQPLTSSGYSTERPIVDMNKYILDMNQQYAEIFKK